MQPAELVRHIPPDWRAALAPVLDAPWLLELARFVEEERRQHTVYPPAGELFAALELTPLHDVRVVILGQDPYHGEGQAHGLCFSVRPGVRPPPSLVNLFKELRSDLGIEPPSHGCLVPWARQGVLLLNAVLTVRARAAGSHAKRGWEQLTDEILRVLAAREQPCVFLLFGAYAQKKARLVDDGRHVVIANAHPSPLSAYRGFFGSRPFSRTNAALRALGLGEIDWRLPNVVELHSGDGQARSV